MDPIVNHNSFIDWAIKVLLISAFGGWAWVVRKFGSDHILSLKRIEEKIDTVVSEMNDIRVRTAVLEHEVANLRKEQ